MSVSRVLLSLLSAALVTALFSFYHVTVLTNQNCISLSEKANFGMPNVLVPNSITHNVTQSLSSKQPIQQPYTGPYKVYTKWTESFPCVPMDPQWKTIRVQRSPASQGLLYVREMKTGSSTLAGVVLRIAHRKAKQLLLPNSNNNGELPCKIRVDHSPARVMQYGERDKKRSFLISLLRDPTKRVMSQFFHFKVSDESVEPTDANFQAYLLNNTKRLSNYYVRDLSMSKINVNTHAPNYDKLVQDIIDQYNFIGITERMDESLIILKLLLNLQFGDILYMSAKNAGSFTTAGGGPKKPPRCIYIVPSFVTPGMKRFFQSKEWKQYIAADVALYQAANASLDKTIDSLSRDLVEKELATFQQLKQQAQERCVDRTIYRCDATGTFVGVQNSTCLLWDVGCGHECLEEFANEISI